MTYQVQLKIQNTQEEFKGPIAKLLELIEEKKLQISEISLAKITDDFLNYLELLAKEKKLAINQNFDGSQSEFNNKNLQLLADFVAVASRLILIKSKALLPNLVLTSEEEAEIRDLEERLKFYQEFRPAMKNLLELWRKKSSSFSRSYFFNLFFVSGFNWQEEKIFYPGRNLNKEAIFFALSQLFKEIEKIQLESQVIKREIITLEDKMQEIISGLAKRNSLNFKEFEKKSISEIIVIFLAILHLAREQLIFLEQNSKFDDIIIKKAQ